MFTIMLVLLFRPVGAQTEDAFPSYIEQCFNNYFNFNPQEKIYLPRTHQPSGFDFKTYPNKTDRFLFLWQFDDSIHHPSGRVLPACLYQLDAK